MSTRSYLKKQVLCLVAQNYALKSVKKNPDLMLDVLNNKMHDMLQMDRTYSRKAVLRSPMRNLVSVFALTSAIAQMSFAQYLIHLYIGC